MSIALPERITYPVSDGSVAAELATSRGRRALGGDASAWVQPALKRLLDIGVALAALILLGPLFLIAAVAIKLDSPGPVLYRQRRLMQHGKGFWLLKFRTMADGSDRRLDEISHLNEAFGPWFKSRNDPRVTRVGRILRSHFLDELPQLVNVLRGEMSLVGPRPCLAHELAAHPDELWFRLAVPQGITGAWQTHGHHALTFEETMLVERDYIRSWSLALDLSILARTVGLVLRRTGY